MAYRLIPRSGQHYLSPRDVVARLLTEFGHVASSDEDGRRYVRAVIQALHDIKEQSHVPVDEEYVDRLRKAEREAVYVYFGDPASGTLPLGVCVIPGQPLFFIAPAGTERAALRNLLMRCASSLHYELVED